MMLGEVSPGGVGVGLMGMLVYALLAVFIAGLMVGRTPEYLGKKIQAAEMKLVVLYIIAMPLASLGFAAAVGGARRRRRRRSSTPGRTACRSALQLRLGRQQQRLGVRRPGHRHRLVHRDAGPGDADRPVLPDHPGARHRRLARPQAAGAGRPRGRSRPTRRCSAASSSARSSSSPASRSSPPSRSARSSSTCRCEVDTMTSTPRPAPRTPLPPRGRRRCAAARPAPVRCSTVPSFGAPSLDALRKLDPRTLARNPVMFVVEVGSVLTTILFLRDLGDSTGDENVFAGLVVVFLWFTVLFANFAEAMAEGRGKAQAATLRKTRGETVARVRRADGSIDEVPSSQLAPRRPVRRDRRRGDPRRRRRRRGHRHGRRVGDHRRVGAGDPRVRRRPLGRHRRHPRAVRRDRRAHHGRGRARRSSTA